MRLDITKKIQEVLLDIFKVFRDLCKKHDLRYFAIYGTCLGAVRHRGFVPWDDDMDIAMPYEDWKTFLALSEGALQYPYSILSPFNDEHERYILKFQNESVHISGSDILSKIHIDVFPVYGIPDGKLKQKLIATASKWLGRCDIAHRLPLGEIRSWINKRLKALDDLYWRTKPYYYFTIKQQSLLGQYKFEKSKYIIFPWEVHTAGKFHKLEYNIPHGNIYFQEDFATTVEVPFADTTMRIPAGYDRYLKTRYGDYMTPPPPEFRVGHSVEIKTV